MTVGLPMELLLWLYFGSPILVVGAVISAAIAGQPAKREPTTTSYAVD